MTLDEIINYTHNSIGRVLNRSDLMQLHVLATNLIKQHEYESNCITALKAILRIPQFETYCVVDKNNKLLLQAAQLYKQDIVDLLLTRHSIRCEAVKQNFYIAELGLPYNLQDVSYYNESATLELSSFENRIFENVVTHNADLCSAHGGIDAVIEEFKCYLNFKYISNPAFIEKDTGEIVKLPFDWDELCKLRSSLTDSQYNDALEAYYEHIYHTAYRYLSAPNHWIDPEAPFAVVTSSGMHAEFQEHLRHIAFGWLAVSDTNIPNTDGFNLSSRQELYSQAIAEINRAGNWEFQRLNPYTEMYEEYDDLQPDRPSCSLGVVRRIFNGIHGHEMFDKSITAEKLRIEFNQFVFHYYENILNSMSDLEIKQLHDDTDEFLYADGAPPKIANIPELQQHEFFEDLLAKYDLNSHNLILYGFIRRMFLLNKNTEGSHFISFYANCGLCSLLKSKLRLTAIQRHLKPS